MKTGIHPEYEVAMITCACGRVTETRSTVGEIHVEICSHCHPFFTGRQKLVDTAGRVERFFAKYGPGSGSSNGESGSSGREAHAATATSRQAPPAEEPAPTAGGAEAGTPAAESESPVGEAETAASEAEPVSEAAKAEAEDEVEGKNAAQDS